MRKTVFLAGAVCLLSVATVGHAQTLVYSNFGPDDSYDSGWGWSLQPSGQEVAGQFTHGGAAQASLDFFRVALMGSGSVSARLLAGADINSATVLESFSTIEAPTSSVYTFRSLLNPLLNPSSVYWIALSASGGSNAWHGNTQGVQGFAYRNGPEASWSTDSYNTSPAFDVYTMPSATVTPEPVSMALLGTGLAGLAAARRRRKKEGEQV